VVELWRVKVGLEYVEAWSIDSIAASCVIKIGHRCNREWHESFVGKECSRLLELNWKVMNFHSYKETTHCANMLAYIDKDQDSVKSESSCNHAVKYQWPSDLTVRYQWPSDQDRTVLI
jgi:uncharacterized protein YhjY with autotransporter beta-barrel domain